MKSQVIISLLILLFVQESLCTHLETCECHEIRSLVNASVEQAIARLEDKLTTEIESMFNMILWRETSFNNTVVVEELKATKQKIEDLEISLTSAMKKLLTPIQQQLDYHLPPPPPTVSYTEENPAESCKAVYDLNHNALSDYYWIKTSSGSAVRMYCNMNATCGNLTGGWTRVAYLDMRNSSHQCPSGFSYTARSSNPRRLCDLSSYGRCVGTNFSVHGLRYSHVYGRIIAYQNGYPVAFNYIYSYSYNSIDKPYIFGVSLTHGQIARNHIWSFVGAVDEKSSNPTYKCPCINTNINPSSINTPSFIGNDYFCDTSLSNTWSSYGRTLHSSDPLWDGEGCGPTNACCSVSNLCGENSPPWFIKHLPSSTTDDIEMRLCRPGIDGSTPIEIVELYVQ